MQRGATSYLNTGATSSERMRLSRRRMLVRIGAAVSLPGALAFVAACGGESANDKVRAARRTQTAGTTVVAAAAMPAALQAATPLQGTIMKTPFDAALKPVTAESVKQVVLTATDDILLPLTSEVTYAGWGFNGTIPGPAIRVRQGDTIEATLANKGPQGHSIDFHAAQTPWDRDFKTILPNQSYTFKWKANYPGCFMYHCGTAPVLHHIANGMYGAIIVEPADGWATKAVKEYALVQSEFYVTGGKGDGKKMDAVQPDFVAFNGIPTQYVEHPLTADPGERVRIYVVNAGPSIFSGFHIVGTVFEAVYPDGNPNNRVAGMQTYTIPPGGGAVFDVVVPDAGMYPIVTHAFAYASKGAVGMLKIGQPADTTTGGG